MVSRNKEIQQMLTEFKRICDCFGHFDIIQDFRIHAPLKLREKDCPAI